MSQDLRSIGVHVQCHTFFIVFDDVFSSVFFDGVFFGVFDDISCVSYAVVSFVSVDNVQNIPHSIRRPLILVWCSLCGLICMSQVGPFLERSCGLLLLQMVFNFKKIFKRNLFPVCHLRLGTFLDSIHDPLTCGSQHRQSTCISQVVGPFLKRYVVIMSSGIFRDTCHLKRF